MRRVGWGMWIKPNVSLGDILIVCDLARAAHNQSFFIRMSYFKKIIAQLTTLKRVWFFHAFFVVKVLVAADMLGNEKTTYDPKEKIQDFVYWLAPRVNLSPKEILHNLNADELQQFAQRALDYKFQRDSISAMAQHMPKEYFDEVRKMYDFKRAAALIARNKEIEETEQNPDPNPIAMLGNAFDPGGYHG